MKSFLLFTCLALSLFQASGQSYAKKQNNVWVFGSSTGISFDGPVPTSIATVIQPAGYACASVSDGNGNLQFYTDGNTLYDKNNNVMPNGYDVTALAYYLNSFTFSPTNNSWHGAQIIPVPGTTDKYYVFAIIDLWVTAHTGEMYYSIVDMSLNGGLGDVVPGAKGILLDNNLATPLAGIAGNDCNMWLLAHDKNTAEFRSYNITTAGISTPVISAAGSSNSGTAYVMVPSPSRLKLAVGSGNNSAVFDFDPSTGIVSNPLALGLPASDAAFSPDNSKLYLSGGTPLYQFDLSSATPTAAVAVTPMILSNGLRLGPDGKVYMSGSDPYHPYSVSCLQQPNLPGAACQFDSGAVSLQFGYLAAYFPSEVPVLIPDTVTTQKSLILCANGNVSFQATVANGHNYLWQDGVTGMSRTVDTPGTFIASYYTFNPCIFHADTFVVNSVGDIVPDLGADTVVCDNVPVTLAVSVPGAAYTWYDGSNGSTKRISQSGKYWVEADKDGCKASDTVQIQFAYLPQDLGPDTTFCRGTGVYYVLKANVANGSVVQWNTGSNAASLAITDTGLYSVTVLNLGCIYYDSVSVHTAYCDCDPFIPSVFSPNGDGKNDVFRIVALKDCQLGGYAMDIYDRWGNQVFTTHSLSEGWDGTIKGVPAEIGTYMYVIRVESGTNAVVHHEKGTVTLVR